MLFGELQDLILGGVLAVGQLDERRGSSPHFSSGMETTATAITAGCSEIACSTSVVEMFSPPETIMSFVRSRSSM